MFIVGTDCRLADFRKCLRQPGLVATAIFGQYLLVPAVTLLIAVWLDLDESITLALLLMSACPSGVISNTYTFVSRGNVSLSVSLTGLSTLAAFVMTPLSLGIAVSMLNEVEGSKFQIPLSILFAQLAFLMILPTTLGMVVKQFAASWVEKNSNCLRYGSLILLFVVIGIVLYASPGSVIQELRQLFFPALLISTVMLLVAVLVARACADNSADRSAVIFEWPCRNLAIAGLLGITALDRPELMLTATSFFLIQAPFVLGLAFYRARLMRA